MHTLKLFISLILSVGVSAVGILSAHYFGIWDLDYPIGLAWIELMGGIGLVLYCFLDRSMNADIGKVLTNVIAVVVGTLLLVPIGTVFDVMGWPLLNTWALSHGVFIVFFPLLLFLVFKLIGFARNGKFIKRIKE